MARTEAVLIERQRLESVKANLSAKWAEFATAGAAVLVAPLGRNVGEGAAISKPLDAYFFADDAKDAVEGTQQLQDIVKEMAREVQRRYQDVAVQSKELQDTISSAREKAEQEIHMERILRDLNGYGGGYDDASAGGGGGHDGPDNAHDHQKDDPKPTTEEFQ